MKTSTFFMVVAACALSLLLVGAVHAVPSFSGYWSLDNNTNDSSGNAQHGNATGVTGLAAANCKIDTCYDWDGGAADVIHLPGNPLNGKSQGAVVFWIYFDTKVSENLFARDSAAFRSQVNANGSIYFQPNGTATSSNKIFSTGRWEHAIFNWNTTHTEIYVNGSLDKNKAGGATTNANNLLLYLGQNSVNGNEDLDGRLDEFGILNESINSSQAACLWNGGTGTNYTSATQCFAAASPALSNTSFTITALDSDTSGSITGFKANVTWTNTSFSLEDRSGNGNNNISATGTPSYESTTSTYLFNGAGQYFTSNVGSLFMNGNFSFSANFKKEGNSSGAATSRIIATRPSGGTPSGGFDLTISSGNFPGCGISNSSGGGITASGSSALSLNRNYNFLCQVYSNGTNIKVTLLIDGVEVGSSTSATIGSELYNGSNKFSIATHGGGTNFGTANGSIGNVYVWNDTRTTAEITQVVANQTVTRQVVAYYPFSDIGNSTWSTTGTSLTTNISNQANMSINATVYDSAANLLVINYFDNTTTNHNTSSNLTVRMNPYTQVTVNNAYDGTPVGGAKVTFNGTIYDTDSLAGNIYLPVLTNTFSVTASKALQFFSLVFDNLIQYNQSTAVEIFQAEMLFSATEVITGNSVTDFTVTTNTGITSTATNPILYLDADTYNITFNKTGWFSETQEITVSTQSNDTYDYDVHAYLLNITFRNILINSSVSTFNVTVQSGDYIYSTSASTSNGTINLPWTADTNANITVESAGYATTSQLFNVTSTITNVVVYGYTSESITFRFYDEATNTLLNGTNVTAYLTSPVMSYNFTTSNGTRYLDLLSPTAYTITYSAVGYSQREYLYTVTNRSTAQLDLYLINDTDDTIILVNVFDTRASRVESAIVEAQKKNLSGTNYYVVEMCRTNVLGQCLLHVDLYDTTYRFIVEYEGETKLNSNDTRVQSTELSFTINLQANLLTTFYELNTLQYNLSSNASHFILAWNDVFSNTQTACLQVQKRSAVNYENQNTSCTSSASGTIVLPYYNSTGDEWLAVAYVTLEDGTRYILSSASIVTSRFKAQFGSNGLFLFGFLLLGTMVFASLTHPIVSIVVLAAGTFILDNLGFISVGTPAVISLILITIVFIFALKKT